MRDRVIHMGRLQTAAAARKPGYLDAHMKVGKIVQIRGMQFVQLSDQNYTAIGKHFALAGGDGAPRRPSLAPLVNSVPSAILTPSAAAPKISGPIQVQPRRQPGKLRLGDLVAKVATPIARAQNLDCIDKTTGQLKPESGCAQRKAALNAIRLPSA